MNNERIPVNKFAYQDRIVCKAIDDFANHLLDCNRVTCCLHNNHGEEEVNISFLVENDCQGYAHHNNKVLTLSIIGDLPNDNWEIIDDMTFSLYAHVQKAHQQMELHKDAIVKQIKSNLLWSIDK